jgi:hypothetical protein
MLRPAEDLSDDLEEEERRSRRRQFTVALLVLLVSLAAIALRVRGHRHLTQLKSELHARTAPQAAPPPAIRPGGQDPIVVSRSALPGSAVPEFISATLLPGRGMRVFQIMASIPGSGEVPLLDSPPLANAAAALSGTGDQNGDAGAHLGAPFELPWAGQISGLSEGKNIHAQWDGRTLILPARRNERGEITATDGLMLRQASESLHYDVMPDGGLHQATFNLGDFGGHWPSQTEATVSILLSGRVIDLTVTARNTGSIPEPIGIGWSPRFVLGGKRSLARLHLPSSLRVEERATGQPTGKLLPVDGTVYDFTERSGVALGDRGVNASFVHLRSGLLDTGPMAELIQPDRGYGLRITALTSNIHNFRVVAPTDQNYISIQPDFNYDDPFGREWPQAENTGMVTLEPGQTTVWKIRMEIFAPPSSSSSRISGSPFDPPR